MKLLTKETDYAVRALLLMAEEKERYFSAAEISEKDNIPYPFLRRILRRLTDEDIIESKEGAGGGVRLKKDPATLRLDELIELFQGKVELADCMFRKQICDNRTQCVLRKTVKSIEKKMLDEIKKVTIKTLGQSQS